MILSLTSSQRGDKEEGGYNELARIAGQNPRLGSPNTHTSA